MNDLAEALFSEKPAAVTAAAKDLREKLRIRHILPREINQQILGKLRQEAEKVQPTARPDFGGFLRFVWNPKSLAFAVSLIACGLLYFLWNSPKTDTRTAITRANGSVEQADLRGGLYSAAADNVYSAALFEGLSLQFRKVRNLGAVSLTAESAALSADDGLMLFTYNNPGKRRAVKIQIRNETFEITGTRFIIAATRDKTSLLVEEGRVIAENATGQTAVTENMLWDNKSGRARIISATKVRAIFSDFAKPQAPAAELENRIEILSEQSTLRPKENSRRGVVIVLKTGEKIVGSIISETPEKITLKTREIDALVIERAKIKAIAKK